MGFPQLTELAQWNDRTQNPGCHILGWTLRAALEEGLERLENEELVHVQCQLRNHHGNKMFDQSSS